MRAALLTMALGVVCASIAHSQAVWPPCQGRMDSEVERRGAMRVAPAADTQAVRAPGGPGPVEKVELGAAGGATLGDADAVTTGGDPAGRSRPAEPAWTRQGWELLAVRITEVAGTVRQIDPETSGRAVIQ